VPVFLPASVASGRNYFIQMIGGPSGFRVETLGDGTLQPIGTSYGGLYGGVTGQFEELSRLWSTYRVDRVNFRFNPSATF
jgi:outer membrane lipoprotein SlyB